MATGRRRSFLRTALQCFQRQTLDSAELIVIDDGAVPAEDLCAGLNRVVYVRLNQRMNLGEKLNIGIEKARGELIQKLDDDDFYASNFLEKAVRPFVHGGADRTKALVVWDCFLVLLMGSPPVRFSGHGWRAGGTFCFARGFGRGKLFRDVPRHVDWYFLHDHKPELIARCAPESYMLVRHGKNTWSANEGGQPVDRMLGNLAPYSGSLRSIVGDAHFDFYNRLLTGSADLQW
jgi:glycosyltransferase involved in cell wall biosynthesis